MARPAFPLDQRPAVLVKRAVCMTAKRTMPRRLAPIFAFILSVFPE
jgi:hypothetical protein